MVLPVARLGHTEALEGLPTEDSLDWSGCTTIVLTALEVGTAQVQRKAGLFTLVGVPPYDTLVAFGLHCQDSF